jgi:hypothetical protein
MYGRSLCKKHVPSSAHIVFFSVADPDPGSGAFLTPGSGIRYGLKIRIRDPDQGCTTRIIFSRAQKQFFELKYINSLKRIRDPGWKNSNPESGMEKIRNNTGFFYNIVR